MPIADLLLLLATTVPIGDQALDQLGQLVRDARGKDSVARLAAYDGLLKRGDEGKKLLLPILRDAEDRAARNFLALPRSPEAAAFRTWLKSEVGDARAAALAVIRDTKVYPDDAHGAVGQPVVDGQVARLRELWVRPSRLFAEKVEDVNIRLYYVKEATDWLKKAGAQPDRFADKKEALAELDAAFDVRALVYDKGDLATIDEAYEENATGASAASDEERRFARILNDYRVMLGLKPLRLVDPLVIAARKHSQEMQDLNYFAHESPVEGNRTPADRARKEGHNGGVLENCAISGDAQDAFDGWYTSSGHHRGLISAGATLLGAGQSVLGSGSPGRHWTMMAGPGVAPKPKSAKKEPREVYFERRKKLRDGDVETRLALARYCRRHELLDEERSVLEDVVKLDPENKTARKLLGHVKHDGAWMTAEERLYADLDSKPKDEVIASASALLGDEDPALRVAAVKVLERVADPGTTPHLARALKDKASEVRMAAASALGRSGFPGAAAALKPALSDSSFYVSHAVAAALYSLGDRSGVPVLFASLRSPDLNHRIDAHKQARSIFGQDFGYAWDLPEVERAKVVDQWEAWVEQQ